MQISPATIEELRLLGVDRVRLLLNDDSPVNRERKTARSLDYVEFDIPSGFNKPPTTTDVTDLELSVKPEPILPTITGYIGSIPRGIPSMHSKNIVTDNLDLKKIINLLWNGRSKDVVWFSALFKTDEFPMGRHVKAAAVLRGRHTSQGTHIQVLEAYRNKDNQILGRFRLFDATQMVRFPHQVHVDANTGLPMI